MKQVVAGGFTCKAGCGRGVAERGTCPRCAEEVDAINRMYFAEGPREREVGKPDLPDVPDWLYYAGALFIVLALAWFTVEFLTGGY